MSNRLHRLLACVISLFAFTSLQAQDRSRVVWQKDNAPQSDTWVSHGHWYHILRANGVGIAVNLLDSKDYEIVQMSVLNNSEKPVIVDPGQMTITYEDKKGKETAALAIKPQKIADKFIGRTASINSTRSIVAGQAEKTTTVRTTSGSATITEPDTEKQKAAAAENAGELADARAHGDSIVKGALFAETLEPKAHIEGNVYFKRVKDARKITVTVAIGNTDYIFNY